MKSWKRLALLCLADGEMTARELRAAMRAKMHWPSRLAFRLLPFYALMVRLENAGLVQHEDRVIADGFWRNGDPLTGSPRRYWATLEGHAYVRRKS